MPQLREDTKGRPYTLYGIKVLLKKQLPGYELLSYSKETKSLRCQCKKHGSIHTLRSAYLFCKTGSNPCPDCKLTVVKQKANKLALSHETIQKRLDLLYRRQFQLLPSKEDTRVHFRCRCLRHNLIFLLNINNALYNQYGQCPMCKHENGRSRYSREALFWMRHEAHARGWRWSDVQHAENLGELKIDGVGNVDGYHAPSNTVLEFHGDDWHGNPKRHPPSKLLFFGARAKDVYRQTLDRHRKIRRRGFNLIWVWESDWKKLRKESMTRIKGVPQYFTDEDLKEQRTGSHKRR